VELLPSKKRCTDSYSSPYTYQNADSDCETNYVPDDSSVSNPNPNAYCNLYATTNCNATPKQYQNGSDSPFAWYR
jgi:hypothetical protein